MSIIHVKVPHTKSLPQLHDSVKRFDEKLKKLGISTHWSGDQGVIKHSGLKKDGSIQLSPHHVEVKIELGFLLSKTIGAPRLNAIITDELTKALA